MVIGKSSQVVPAKDAVFSDLAQEVAILNLKSGVYYGLDAVGARIWHLIQESGRVEAILQALLRQYDVEPERCERDLLRLLQDLAAAGLIEIRDEPAA